MKRANPDQRKMLSYPAACDGVFVCEGNEMNDIKTIFFTPYTILYESATDVSCDAVGEYKTFRFKRNSKGCTVTFQWTLPIVNIRYCWHSACKFNRELHPDWRESIVTSIATSAPVFCFLDAAGKNRYTIALSDPIARTEWRMGVHEETNELYCQFMIRLRKANGQNGSALTIYTDENHIPLSETLRHVNEWWENSCGYDPMMVPEAGRKPFYSTWYSMHQNVAADKIEEQCRLAKGLGMDTVIVDDGWQTDDNHRGYGYTGDWKVSVNKFPNFREHVDRVHALGMKYMLWFSVPFVGKHSKGYEQFKEKYLRILEDKECGILDPRFPDVRNYLIETYRSAVLNWNLDGLKLDFIDSFVSLSENEIPPFQVGMDFSDVESAVYCLMNDIKDTLLQIRPDILIEFRQSYTGPAMRTYGNLFRVSDCPCDVQSNRVGMTDLRMFGIDSAIHSDMLEWNMHDSIESIVNQIMNIIFTVPQISVDLTALPEEQEKAVKFWLTFIRENEEVLQRGELSVDSPQNLYPVVMSRKEGKAVIAVYEDDHIVRLPQEEHEIVILNAGSKDGIVAVCEGEDCNGREYFAAVQNCMGENVKQFHGKMSGVFVIPVPASGLVRLQV